MIYAQPGEAFQAVTDGAGTGLVGTLGVQLLQNATDAIVLARSTANISEPVGGSGVYVWKAAAAPVTEGRYTVIWDNGGGTFATDDLIVGGPAPFGPGIGGAGTLVDTLVAAVQEQGAFDVPQGWVLGWLDGRHKLMCSRTRCFRKRLTIATVAGQTNYPVPAEVQEILQVTVGSPASNGQAVPFIAGWPDDLPAGALGFLWLRGTYVSRGGGVFVRDESSEGADEVALYPTPSAGGQAISMSTVCRPPALTLGTALRTPPEFDDALVAGAIATGLERTDARQDIGASGEQKFGIACEELKRQVRERFKGTGASQIRVRR